MAFRVAPKLMSTSCDTFKHPHYEQYDYKFYHPQLFTSTLHHYEPDKGTKKFFNDYRRCHVSELTLKKNLDKSEASALQIRPTWYSDKTDRVLGRRKIDREALFPIIHNKPLYKLSNCIPDRERDRDKKLMDEAQQHRRQYKDLTGSRHERVSYFHRPGPASDIHMQKKKQEGIEGDYPNNLRVVQEAIYRLQRQDPMVNLMDNDVF